MNPWYEQLVDDCMAEHDRVCIDGAECKQREVHTESAYIAPALRHRLAALQGQVAHADARIKAVEDVLDAADDRGPIGLAFDGTPFPAFVSSADIRRALDGEQ